MHAKSLHFKPFHGSMEFVILKKSKAWHYPSSNLAQSSSISKQSSCSCNVVANIGTPNLPKLQRLKRFVFRSSNPRLQPEVVILKKHNMIQVQRLSLLLQVACNIKSLSRQKPYLRRLLNCRHAWEYFTNTKNVSQKKTTSL